MAAVVPFVDEGLGHSSYLVDLGDGTALVVDPARIPSGQRDQAQALGLRIAFTADTHTHADYISGSPDLAADGATFLAPAAAHLGFSYVGLADGDEIEVGNYRLRALATPGHTPDHLAYLLLDENRPVALFSGGSLMVGAVGRTDLLGDEHREELAHELYRALHERVLTLPSDLPVLPTHGAGSFCSAPAGSSRTTTIGRERETNPLLNLPENEFVASLVAGLGSFPDYFRRLPSVNQHGVPIHANVPALSRLTLAEFDRAIAAGAVVVDARPAVEFATAHIPGALSIALRDVFATWLGWLTELDEPVVVVLDDNQDERDLVRQAMSVGHDALVGRLTGGMRAWRDAGRPVASTRLVEPDDLRGVVLDVRQANEFDAGHVPGAVNVELGSLAHADIPTGSVVVMCGKSERAMSGASVLQRRGDPDVAVVRGGYGQWQASRDRARL